MKLRVFLNAAAFSLIMFGYGLVAIFVTDQAKSKLLTIPYRVIVLVISLYFIYIKVFGKKKNVIDQFLDGKTYFKSRESIRIFPLVAIFWVIYSFRFFNDVHGKLVFGDEQYYFSFLFLICWIPSFSFLMIDLKRPKEYLYIAQCTLITFGLFMLARLSYLKTSVFYTVLGRLSSEALNPISLGTFSGSLIILSTYILLQGKEIFGGFVTRIICFASILLGLYFLVSAASRGPIISTVICVLIIFASYASKIIYVGLPATIAGGMVMVDFILPLLQVGKGSNLDRLTSIGDKSAVERSDFLQMSFKLVSENWHNTFFGYGVELPKFGYPHNIIVESFLSTGVIGGCLFTLICLVVLIRSLDLSLSRDPWGWVGVLYVQAFIMSLTSGAIYAASAFWYLLFAVNNLWVKKDYASIYKRIQEAHFEKS